MVNPNDPGYTSTIETVRELFAKQRVIPVWMRRVCGADEDALVEVVRRETPFGSFVVSVQLWKGEV